MRQAVFAACPEKHNPGESTLKTPIGRLTCRSEQGLRPACAGRVRPDRRSDACSNNSHEGITTDIC